MSGHPTYKVSGRLRAHIEKSRNRTININRIGYKGTKERYEQDSTRTPATEK